MITDGTQGMTFNLFIGKLTVGSDPFPLKASASYVFLDRKRLSGPPSSGSFNSLRVRDDTIVLCAVLVDHCWILFIDKVLFTQFELEFVRGIGEQP